MNNKENEKIRIPNETYCPSKKIEFNINQNNNSSNISPLQSSINKNINNINTFSNQNFTKTLPITNENSNHNLNLFSQDNSSEEGVTISPIKSIVTSASSKPTTIIQPQCKLEKFLPPKTSKFQKTLVLDLDETLIHSYFDCPSPRQADLSYDILVENKKIHVNSMIRPGAREFIENVSTLFEIVVFTASLSEYANPLVDFVDKNKKCNFRLYREHCCCFNNGFTNCFTKDLKKLDRDMNYLIIIDNNPKSYILNKENGIPIKTWVEDINDRELYKLIPYLLFLGNENVKDVRPFLKQVNSGNALNYDKFDKIILNYNNDNEKNSKECKFINSIVFVKDNNTNKNIINKEKQISNEKNNINTIIKNNNSKTSPEKINNSKVSVKENKKIIENNSNIIQSKNNIKNLENKNNNINDENKNQNENNKNKNEKINNIMTDNCLKINDKQLSKENNNEIKKNKENKDINYNNFVSENNITIKNKIFDKNNQNEIIKNMSSNDMIKVNNFIVNKENIKTNNKNNDKIDEKNKSNNNKQNNKTNNNQNQNNNKIKQKNNINKKRILKENQNILKKSDSTKNINKGNNGIMSCKNRFENKVNKRTEKNNVPYRIRYNINKEINNNALNGNYYLNNRYENIFKEEENIKQEENIITDENNNNNKINNNEKEEKNKNIVCNSTQYLSFNGLDRDKSITTSNNQMTKSTNNISSLRNNYMNFINNSAKTDNQKSENEIVNKAKKEIKIDIINNFRPTSDLLNEYMTNLNKGNDLKSIETPFNKTLYLSDENQEKTIVNDDIEEEEKNENKVKDYEEKELFDDIDTEKEDINDSNLINSDKNEKNKKDKQNSIFYRIKEDFKNKSNKKYFEADDILEFNKSMKKEKIIEENNENESNTINTKSPFKPKKRKFNKNLFNKSKAYPMSNKKELELGNKYNKNRLFINNYQSSFKNSVNNNKFLQSSKNKIKKELFNYSSRKKGDKRENNIISSNYQLFKEKEKSNVYLKNNSNNNIENIDSLFNKEKPIIKHNSKNVFHFKSNNPKTNRNKINENHKFSLFKKNNFNNAIKSNNNDFYILQNNIINKTDKKLSFSNRENNLLFNDSSSKIKRPISCSNKISESINYDTKNPKTCKVMKFAKQGKKIYLKTSSKTNSKANINLENINNATINLNDKINNCNKINLETIYNINENCINLVNKNIVNPFSNTILPSSDNIITDFLFVRNIGKNSSKKSNREIKYNLYEENEEKQKNEKQKRLMSAKNEKIIKNNNINILS